MKEITYASWTAVASREFYYNTHFESHDVDRSNSIARKSNFRKHLVWHKIYSPGMELEDYWKRRDTTLHKRSTFGRNSIMRSGSSDMENGSSQANNGDLYQMSALHEDFF